MTTSTDTPTNAAPQLPSATKPPLQIVGWLLTYRDGSSEFLAGATRCILCGPNCEEIAAVVLAEVDPADGFIAVTSRASYEMVYKTASAGVGLLAAVSAPTGLAVRTAESAGLVLAGFVRGERAAVYTHPERVR